MMKYFGNGFVNKFNILLTENFFYTISDSLDVKKNKGVIFCRTFNGTLYILGFVINILKTVPYIQNTGYKIRQP